jgi:porin
VLRSRYYGSGNPAVLLVAVVAALLSLCWKEPSLAAQTSTSDPRPETTVQSSTSPTPPTPQNPSADSASQAEAAPAPAAAKQRKLKCQHPANPNKRRFGCKNEDYDWEETLAGDWDGARAEGKKLGITPSGSYYSVLQTNLTGKQHQMWGYVGQLTTAVDFDFEKLLKINGMSLYFSDSWGTGSNLTAAMGSVFPVNPNYAVGPYLGEIYLQQKFIDGHLTVAGGRLAANYTFAGLPVFDNYVSFAIDPTPVSIVNNDLSYAGPPPGLQWGAQAVYSVTPVVELAAGAFNTNLNSANNGNVLAFQQGNKGALVTAQASYLYNQRPSETGMQGQYTAGFFEDNNAFAVLPHGSFKSDGNHGVFMLGQQMLYRPDGPGTSQGLTVWGAWEYSPKQLVSPMPVFGGAGISYQGLIKKRKQDIVSAGWIYGKTSQFIPYGSSAKLWEVNYQWVPKRYITIIPDLQYIVNPTGITAANSAVFGVQLNLTF